MEEKSKLLVFDKKEVILLLVFMILTAVISFAVGVKVGKDYSYYEAGYQDQDRQVVEDVKSPQEERAEQIVEQAEEQAPMEDIQEEGRQRLMQEMEQSVSEQQKPEASDGARVDPMGPARERQAENGAPNDPNYNQQRAKYLGKYTVQLGSHPTLEEAKQFADGFRALGYGPIINEVDLGDRGLWYRVSIGAFDTVAEAKEYIEEEESLFQGQDYVITQIN